MTREEANELIQGLTDEQKLLLYELLVELTETKAEV